MSIFNLSNWADTSNQPVPYVTKTLEPIYDGPDHIATKSTYRYLGEYLPFGRGNGLNLSINEVDQTDFQLITFLNGFTSIFETDNGDKCILSDVNVENNKAYGIIPYNVTCDCYNFLSGNGVIGISNQLNFNENEDRTINVDHSISIKYLNIDQNNITTAKTLARSLTGNVSDWKFLDYNFGAISPILTSSRETADISAGNYSIQQSFLIGKNKDNGLETPVIKTNITIQSGLDNATLNLRGNVFTGKANFELSDFKDYLDVIVPTDFKAIGGTISDDTFSKNLNFDLQFSNDKRISQNGNLKNQNISVDVEYITESYRVNFQSQAENVVTIDNTTLDGDLIKDPAGAKTLMNPFFDINSAYKLEGITGYATGKMTYSESSERSLRITGENGKVKFYDLSISINAKPGLYQASFAPVLSGKGGYYVQDLDFRTRGTANLSVQGKCTVDSIGSVDTRSLSQLLDRYKSKYMNDAILLNDELSLDPKALSFKYTYELSHVDDSFKDYRAK
jgi:hypothetical protein